MSLPILLTQEWLDINKELKDKHPLCSKCGKELQANDQVDSYHPYCSEYNLCTTCNGKPFPTEVEKIKKLLKWMEEHDELDKMINKRTII